MALATRLRFISPSPSRLSHHCYRYASTAATTSEGGAPTDEQHGSSRKPMIKFNSKDRHAQKLEAGQPHPCTPPDIIEKFSTFGKSPVTNRTTPPTTAASSSSSTSSTSSTTSSSSSSQSQSQGSQGKASSSGSQGKVDYEEFFQAPKRYWQRPELSEAEMEAIMTGGATSVMHSF